MEEFAQALSNLAVRTNRTDADVTSLLDERRAVVDAILAGPLGSPAMEAAVDMPGKALDAESSELVRAAANRFRAVMAVWNPVFYTSEDVERVFGPPTSSSTQNMEYVLDNGWNAPTWRFHVHDDVVTGVELVPSR
jgi:hypothetical protein